MSMYDLLAATIKLALSFLMGPSSVNLEKMLPIPP